eukprot:5904416-Pleurochrysis_carterae.AAC.5
MIWFVELSDFNNANDNIPQDAFYKEFVAQLLPAFHCHRSATHHTHTYNHRRQMISYHKQEVNTEQSRTLVAFSGCAMKGCEDRLASKQEAEAPSRHAPPHGAA